MTEKRIMKSADTERLHRPSISFRNGPRTQEGVTGQLSLCYRRKAMLTSEAFIQNIGFISEESVAWLNDEEGGGGEGGNSLQWNRQWQDHQSVHTAVEQGMVRPSVCSHDQWNREWQDHQYFHMCSGTGNGKTISMFTCAVEQAIARPSVCAHNRQWQDHQSVHTCSGTGNGKTISMFIRAMAQAIARPSVCAHNRQRQDHNSVHMCSGTGNGKTISMFIRAKCLECDCVAEIVYS